MAGRFSLLTDNHVQQRLVEALRQRGWDVVRAIDVHPERMPDDVLFDYAAKEGRVFVTNDELIQKIGVLWMRESRHFSGLIYWPQEDYQRLTTGDIVNRFEAYAEEDNPFRYPIRYLKP